MVELHGLYLTLNILPKGLYYLHPSLTPGVYEAPVLLYPHQ